MELVLWKCGGPRYRLRGGGSAVILESNAYIESGRWVRIWQGRLWNGEWREWFEDGRHVGGDALLDLTGEPEST